jgi:tRNA (guanine37-N1)-methyltransferase
MTSAVRSFRWDFLSLFPEVIEAACHSSILDKARARGLLEFHFHQIRDFSEDRHRTVDDKPYGGGDGMLLKADVLYRAWQSVVPHRSERIRTILMSPQGKVFDQDQARDWVSKYDQVVLICGHYEGVDERFIEECVDEEVSIGNFVLTGGELPAAVVADAVSRWVPGVVGKMGSVTQDSLEEGLLKYPQFTRPPVFEGRGIPEVLLSGNHAEIERWRHAQREERTRLKRPDLWEEYLEKHPSRSVSARRGKKT